MGNLFGYKRWYEVSDRGDNKIKRKVKIKRNYDGNKYILNINENNNKEKIENNEFIREFVNYKKNDNVLREFKRKFHAGNILFKLKGNKRSIEDSNDFLKTEEIILDKEVYGQSEKLRNEKGITKQDILKEIIDKGIDKSNDKILVKTKFGKEITINFTDEDKKNKKEYQITLKIIPENELKIKREVYNVFKIINMNLYQIIKGIIENKEIFKNRYYDEILKEKLSKNNQIINTLTNLNKIRKEIRDNRDNIIGFVKFYLNVSGDKKKSENKKMFVEKILNINVDLTVEDIVDFIVKELKFWNITKRIEKVKEFNNKFLENKRNRTYIKSYVLLDKHEKFKIERENKKDKIVKFFVENIKNNSIKEKIEKILAEFKIDELTKKLEKELKKGNCDTEIFGIFKKHYKVNFDSKKFSNKSDEEKELYKIIYRYLKGRIEKILINEEKVRLKKMEKIEIKKILNESILSEKILKRVKQYTLEHIVYLGKLVHNKINMATVNTNDFSKLHAKEELDLELITFFASTNMELNKIFNGKEKVTDFFGFNLNGQKITLKEKVPSFKLNILKKLNFINNENNIDEKLSHFYSFQEEGYLLRNKILHNSYGNIQETKNLEGEYENVENLIKELKVSNEEISKSLNLDIIFEGKVDIINKINSLEIGEYKDKKYLPSFSKIVPEITRKFREINKYKSFDIESEKIILNAVKYVNKILYEKITSNEENEFIKTLPDKLVRKNNNKENKNLLSIEEYYKNAQISSSKGDKKAIKKYQNKVINAYLEYLENTFVEVIDFSNFNLNFDEIKTKIEERKDSKNKIVIDSISTNINITNDTEYIISIFALLNNNTYINKIRNRFFATSVWLEKQNSTKEYDYENIISILDEIIQLNTLRNECITENWNFNLKEFIQKMLDVEKEIGNFEIKTKKEIFDIHYEEIKKDMIVKINDNKIQKILNKHLKEITGFSSNNEYMFKNLGKLTLEERDFILSNKKLIEKNIDEIIGEKLDAIKEKILLRKVFSSEFLEKYKKEIDNLVEDTESENKNKFEKIYYPEEHKNELYIYKKNLFLNIGNPNFDKIYELISKDIKNANTGILFDDDIRKNKIAEIDVILKNLNDKLNGFSSDYKEKYVNKLKENDDFFTKNIQNENYSSFREFKKDYNKVSEYKKIRDLVEFNYLNKIESYLIDINWKLAIQMARFERDMHYIVNGLRELGIIKLNGYNTGISRAYPKRNGSDDFYATTAYYKFFDEESYKKFEKICYGFGIDLSENSEINKPENESIRNYTSHFYIVRNPFADYSIAEQIDRVSNLLSYSTRYNNSIYASVFEVFKKDVDLDYDELKKKFKLIGNNDILERLMKPKKVSVLELESYNSDYIKNLIIELLTKVENKYEISS